MTCKNSFWTNLKVNIRRRVWVWALAVFSLLVIYPGMLTVSFAKIEKYYETGNYRTTEIYYEALSTRALETLTDSRLVFVILALAVVIALQGYSYLFSRSKVDMYASVPVTMKSRFFAIYLNGIIMFVSSLLLGFAAAFIMIAAKGIFTWTLASRLLLCMLMTFLVFLGAYDLSILAVMLTGNVMIAGIMSCICIFYADIWTYLINTYRSNYYATLITSYNSESSGISPYKIFAHCMNQIGSVHSSMNTGLTAVGFGTLKLLAWIILPLIWSYSAYKKRPMESAGSSLAFYSSRVLIKLMVSVPAGLFFGSWIYTLSEGSRPLMIGSLVAGTVLTALITEIAFNFELKSAFRHWGIIIVSLMFVMGFYAVHSWDLLGYDRYVPDADKLESYAVLNYNESNYSDGIDFSADKDDYEASYIESHVYAKENMYVLDTEAITALAKKSVEMPEEQRDSALWLEVYYRLKSGRTRSRMIWVDPNDEENEDYLNRIIGPAYYKIGIWQAMTTDVPEERVDTVTYVTPNISIDMETGDAQKLVELWREDMNMYDYDRIRYNPEIGFIQISFDNYSCWNLPVYDCFDGIVGYLSANDWYESTQLTADAIDAIDITYYPISATGDYYLDSETYEFKDAGTIARIMADCSNYPIHSGWLPTDRFSYEYSVEMLIKPEYISKYRNYSLLTYGLLSDKVEELKAAELLP